MNWCWVSGLVLEIQAKSHRRRSSLEAGYTAPWTDAGVWIVGFGDLRAANFVDIGICGTHDGDG